MQLKYKNGWYWLKAGFTDRHKIQKAGFNWNRPKGLWFTTDPMIAFAFVDSAVDEETRKRLTDQMETMNACIGQSRAGKTTRDFKAPKGLKYFEFQKAGIAYALERDSTLIADQMGLGKTIQVIGVMNETRPKRTLIICPATAKINWQRELEKWLANFTLTGVVYGKNPWPNHPITIINYDILARFHAQLHKPVWDLVVVDESHYLKNPDTIRTLEVFGRKSKKRPRPPIRAKRKLLLTGTPIVNRPVELFPSLNYLDPATWSSFWRYAMRYCGAFNDGYGWDFSGSSNLEELMMKLRSTIMVRRLKKDVLQDLPDKIRQVVELPADGRKTVLRVEKAKMKEYKKQVKDLSLPGNPMVFDSISAVRHETALAKVPAVVDYLKETIALGEKVVCFAWHRDVIDRICEAFDKENIGNVKVYGATRPNVRQHHIDRFQRSEDIRLFVGNIMTAGTAITLTAASKVIFAELDWVPGNITQAEDRCHRIGQKDTVNAIHLVLEGSIDAYMANILVRKQEVIDRALDGKEGATEAISASSVLKELLGNY